MQPSQTTQIEALLGTSFCQRYHIDTSANYSIEWVRAKDLLVCNRIDLMAKYKYAQALERGVDCPFFEELYLKHIEAFTRGTYTEVGQESTKNSAEKYISTFKAILADVKERGLCADVSVVPVGRDNAIMDGAHRVAAAACYDLEVPIVRLDWLEPHNDAQFFRERMLDEVWLDYIVSQYCKEKDSVYVACMWPKANTKKLQEQAEALMCATCRIVYKRALPFDFHALRNFMIQVYSSFNWLGGLKDHFSGASGYAELVYDKSETLNVYVLEGAELDQILALKKQIRELYDLGNTSIHISDTVEEARSMVDMLLNANSRHCLRYAQPDKFIPFNEKIARYKQVLKDGGLWAEEHVLDSGSIMALYGLRDATDIDYIGLSGQEVLGKLDPLFQNHADSLPYYQKTAAELIFDPRNHLYYYGVKFIALPVFADMKRLRDQQLQQKGKRNPKDAEDLALLEQVGTDQKKTPGLRTLYFRLRRGTRNLKYKLQMKVLHDEKWSLVRKVYHLVRRGRWY